MSEALIHFLAFNGGDNNNPDRMSGKDLGLCIGAVATIGALLCVPSWLGGSLNVAFLAGIGILGLTLGFGLDGHFTGVDWIGQMMAGWCLATCVEGAGGLRWLTDFFAKWFKHTHAGFSKWRWAWIFIAASMAYLVAILSGSAAAIAFLMYPLAIEVSKDIGLRPGKAVAGVLIGAQFGEIGSPLSTLFETYVRAPIAVNDKLKLAGMDLKLSFPSRLQLCLVLIPATYVGVLIGCLVAVWYGKDLASSKTFKRRLIAGLASCNYPERYLSDQELQQMATNLQLKNSKKDGVVMNGVADTPAAPPPVKQQSSAAKLQKPLHDFSSISVLTEGDYQCTIPIVSGGSAAEDTDINRRENVSIRSRTRSEHQSLQQKPTTLAEDLGGPPPPSGPVSRVVRPFRARNQFISLTIATIGVCWVIIYAMLSSDAMATTTNEATKARTPILTIGERYLNVVGTYLACSILIVLACSVPVEQLNINRYHGAAFVGVINASIVGACFQMIIEKYGMTPFGNPNISDGMNSALAVVPFLAAGLALIFNNWTETAAAFFLAMVTPKVGTNPTAAPYTGLLDYRYYVGFIPALGLVNLVPWHSLSLYAIEIDDTRTTRYGKFLLDNSFAGPVFCACAAATGIAVGIAVGVIDADMNPMGFFRAGIVPP